MNFIRLLNERLLIRRLSIFNYFLCNKCEIISFCSAYWRSLMILWNVHSFLFKWSECQRWKYIFEWTCYATEAPGDEKNFKETRSVRTSACSKTYIFVRRVRQKTEKYIILTFFRTIRWTDRITEQQSCTNGSWFTKPFLFFQLNESYRSICNFLLMIKGTQPSLSAVIEFFQCNSFVVQREHFFKTKLPASHWAVKERIKGFFSFFFFHYEC